MIDDHLNHALNKELDEFDKREQEELLLVIRLFDSFKEMKDEYIDLIVDEFKKDLEIEESRVFDKYFNVKISLLNR